MEKDSVFYATGKRKNAIARTWLKPGSGEITVNNKALADYFPIESSRTALLQPLILTDNRDAFDINVKVKGGGFSGQTIAVRHGITKALIESDPELRQLLKKAGFVFTALTPTILRACQAAALAVGIIRSLIRS